MSKIRLLHPLVEIEHDKREPTYEVHRLLSYRSNSISWSKATKKAIVAQCDVLKRGCVLTQFATQAEAPLYLIGDSRKWAQYSYQPPWFMNVASKSLATAKGQAWLEFNEMDGQTHPVILTFDAQLAIRLYMDFRYEDYHNEDPNIFDQVFAWLAPKPMKVIAVNPDDTVYLVNGDRKKRVPFRDAWSYKAYINFLKDHPQLQQIDWLYSKRALKLIARLLSDSTPTLTTN